MAHRIVLLHATPVAMQPVQTAFEQRWPEAETINLLDDGLSIDRARDADLTPAMIERFVGFGQYGARMRADGILVTCSAFGPAIERLAASVAVPVLKPNEAMFEAAVAHGSRIGMLATFAPSVRRDRSPVATRSPTLRPARIVWPSETLAPKRTARRSTLLSRMT